MSYEPIFGVGVLLVAAWTLLLVRVDRRRTGPALRSSFVMFGIPLILVAVVLSVVPPEQSSTVAIVGLLALIGPVVDHKDRCQAGDLTSYRAAGSPPTNTPIGY